MVINGIILNECMYMLVFVLWGVFEVVGGGGGLGCFEIFSKLRVKFWCGFKE